MKKMWLVCQRVKKTKVISAVEESRIETIQRFLPPTLRRLLILSREESRKRRESLEILSKCFNLDDEIRKAEFAIAEERM